MKFLIQCPVTGGYIETNDGAEAKTIAEGMAERNPNKTVHVYQHIIGVRYNPERQDNAD